MALQIANPKVVAKVERLSRAVGCGKTAAVEAAVDRMLEEVAETGGGDDDPWAGADAILAQLRRLPRRPDAFEAVEWDENGLPR